MHASPMDAVGQLWGGALPAFESSQAANAFDAALVNGTKILSVNGQAYTPAVLRDAVAATVPAMSSAGPGPAPAPLQLVVQRGDAVRTVTINYSGGLRYPWLERIPGKGPAGLDLLLAPRAARPAPTPGK